MDEAFMAFTSAQYFAIEPVGWPFPVGDLLYRGLVFYDELTSAREIMFEAHAIAAKPYCQAVDDWKKWEESLKNFYSITAAISVPSYGRGMEIKILEAEAGGALGSLALASAAYRADHKVYPTSLEQLTPDYISHIPADPYDGKPLKLASGEDGLVLYSVGPDLTDDGGAKEFDSRSESQDQQTGDIVFILGSGFEERRLEPSRAFLEKGAKERESRPKK
jgi:hypothetical protein